MLTPSPEIVRILAVFEIAMTAPAFAKSLVLIYGAILAPGRRTVSAVLRVMGLGHLDTYGNYHRVLNRDRWSPWVMSQLLLEVLIQVFIPQGGTLVLIIDETLERRQGKKIKYKGRFHDAVRSTKHHVVTSLGVRWCCIALLVEVPWNHRAWALPFLGVPVLAPKTSARWHKRHRTSVDWAMILIGKIRRWHLHRDITLVGDGSYAAVALIQRCQHLTPAVRLVSRLRLDAVLHDEPGPPVPHRRGPRPKKGARQVSLATQLTAPATLWTPINLPWYDGADKSLDIVTGVSLWYHPGTDPVRLRWVLVRCPRGSLKPAAFFCSDPSVNADLILRWFVSRWNIEVTFEELRAQLGFETQRQWVPQTGGHLQRCVGRRPRPSLERFLFQRVVGRCRDVPNSTPCARSPSAGGVLLNVNGQSPELKGRPGFDSSYSALCRHIRQIEGPVTAATVRVETAPGEEAQVDFGYAGLMYDPATKRARKSWTFVMTLSWSRHQYVQFVFDQRVETWLTLHRQAFEWFGGVPRRIKLDNLKAAIVKACVDDPQVQRSYRECAEHYGFVIAPCRVATPRHKGKVERGVGYVAGNFLAGRDYTQVHCNVQQANADARQWVIQVAGQRIHGTTRERPLARFHDTEQAVLQALPARPYEMAVWTALQLHRDCYIVFEQAYYSAPFRLIGERLPVRATATTVQIYDPKHALVATHTRAIQAGERKTNFAHLPPGKAAGVQMETLPVGASLPGHTFHERAAQVGPHVVRVMDALLEDRSVDKRHTADRLLKLAQQHGAATLDQACERALDSGDPSPLSVRNWIKILCHRQAASLAQQQRPGSEWDITCHDHTPLPVFARTARELLPAIAFAQPHNTDPSVTVTVTVTAVDASSLSTTTSSSTTSTEVAPCH